MNLNQLKIFYLAARLENLSRAAAKLNITQPAVTKGIQRIQEFYEIKLVNRFGKKLVMTDAGEALYRIAEKIFDLEAQAEESIREFQQQKRGHIRIHAGESFGAYYLPSIMNPFSLENPGIRISVNILPSDQVVENVANLKSDLGFVSYPIKHEKVLLEGILEDQLVFVAPKDHALVNKKRLTSMDLSGQPIVVHERGSVQSRAITDYVRTNKISVDIQLELSSNRAIKKAVESRLGLALISRKVAEDEISAGLLTVLPLPGSPIRREFYMVRHKDKYISEVLQRLIDQVNRWAAEYMASIR